MRSEVSERNDFLYSMQEKFSQQKLHLRKTRFLNLIKRYLKELEI